MNTIINESIIDVSMDGNVSKIEASIPVKESYKGDLPPVPITTQNNSRGMGSENDLWYKENGEVNEYIKANPLYNYQNEETYPVYINKTYNEKDRIEHIYRLISKLDISDEVEIENHEDFNVTCGYFKQKKISIDFESHGSYYICFSDENTSDMIIEIDCINQTKKYIQMLIGDVEGLNYKVEQEDYAFTIYIYSNSTDIIDEYPLFRFKYTKYGDIYIKCYRDNSEFYSKYPIKTAKEAEESMLAGNYFGPFGSLPENPKYNIIACDLRYITEIDCEFIQPYYVFVFDFNPGSNNSYINTIYVQAVKDKYIVSEKLYNDLRGQ